MVGLYNGSVYYPANCRRLQNQRPSRMRIQALKLQDRSFKASESDPVLTTSFTNVVLFLGVYLVSYVVPFASTDSKHVCFDDYRPNQELASRSLMALAFPETRKLVCHT